MWVCEGRGKSTGAGASNKIARSNYKRWLKLESKHSPAYKKSLFQNDYSEKLVQFSVPLEDLILIYKMYIRFVTEQSSVVCYSTLTKGEIKDLERTRKVALKIILGEDYNYYENGL